MSSDEIDDILASILEVLLDDGDDDQPALEVSYP